jgi:26S proteasome regulatory subunit N13
MMPSVSLADILSPARLTSLLDANPSLAESLYAYLPSDTSTVPHNLETLKRVVTSPELRKSARSLDQALTTGALGPLAATLGMTEEETFGVENYLKGVQRLGDEERRKTEGGNDSMRID